MHISTRGQAQLQGDVRLPEFHGAISLTAWKRSTELQDVVAQVRQGQAQGIRMVKDPGVRLIPREGFKTEAIPIFEKPDPGRSGQIQTGGFFSIFKTVISLL